MQKKDAENDSRSGPHQHISKGSANIDTLSEDIKHAVRYIDSMAVQIHELTFRIKQLEDLYAEEEMDDDYESDDFVEAEPKPLKKQKAKDISKWINKKEF